MASYLRWHRATDPDGLTNDVFAQVHRNLPRFEGDEHGFRSWVFTIAHHRMIDDRRRANRQPQLQDDLGVEEHMGLGDVEDDAFAVLAHDRVRDLLTVLSPDQRDVVLLRIIADLSVEEVARMLDKREGAIKALQHRALATLRRHLRSYGGCGVAPSLAHRHIPSTKRGVHLIRWVISANATWKMSSGASSRRAVTTSRPSSS